MMKANTRIYRVYKCEDDNFELLFEGSPMEVLRFTKKNEFDHVFAVEKDDDETEITRLYKF